MQTIIWLTVVGIILWLIYWVIVRPTVLDCIQDEFERLKAQVDMAIVRRLPKEQQDVADFLSEALESPEFVRWISFSHIFFLLRFNKEQMKQIRALSEKEKRLLETAPEWMREVKNEASWLAVKATLLNSPTWWIPIMGVLFCAQFSIQIANLWNDAASAAEKMRVPPSSHSGCKLPA